MEIMHTIPKWVQREAVSDCKDVTEFAHKYRKPERFIAWGEAYVKAVMQSHQTDIDRHGYTSIAHHDNITGRLITYIPDIKA